MTPGGSASASHNFDLGHGSIRAQAFLRCRDAETLVKHLRVVAEHQQAFFNSIYAAESHRRATHEL
jgi:hypothetical protein